MNKTLTTGAPPAFIHSERGNGFHNWFKDECKKVEVSAMKVQIVSTPSIVHQSFLDNYDDINWKYAGKSIKKLMS